MASKQPGAAPARSARRGAKPAGKPAPSATAATGVDAILAAHNSRFKKAVTYEPRRHGVRDVRAWERETGKAYSKLSMAERASANAEIAARKRATE